MTDHTNMREGTTILQVNDTVTSPLGLFVMKLESKGLSLTSKAGNKVWIVNSCLGVQNCKLTASALAVAASITGWTDQVTAFTPYGLDVQDSGQVVIYSADGSAQQVVQSFYGGS